MGTDLLQMRTISEMFTSDEGAEFAMMDRLSQKVVEGPRP